MRDLGLTRGNETTGMLLGLLGVATFSLTLPMTRMAVMELDPILVTLARLLIASGASALILIATRQPLPHREHVPGLVMTALGIVLAFPLLMAFAMRSLPASHGAVVTGILPMTTAVFAALISRERPSFGFWLAAMAGAALVVTFALRDGSGLQLGDLLLFAAVCGAGFGYAKGAQLAGPLGGWQVICWVNVVSAPALIVAFAWLGPRFEWAASPQTWGAVVYLGLVNQLLGFFPWYLGLKLGGTARVGQVQLLQPFLTLIGAAILLGEALTPATVGFGVAVVACVLASRLAAVRREVGANPEPAGLSAGER